LAKKEAVGEGGQEAEVPAGDVQKEQLRRMVKMLFAFFGVGIGLLGMVAAILFYFTAASAIGSTQSAVNAQLEAVQGSLGNAEAAVADVEGGVAEIPPVTSNLSAALTSTATATGGISSSLISLAGVLDAMPLISADTAGIRGSARQMANASESFQASADSMGRLASKAEEVRSDLAGMRTNIASSRAALASARGNLDGSFNSMRISVLLIALMFFFAFALLMVYAVTALI